MDYNQRIKSIVDTLELLPHPEGGFYKETHRSDILIAKRNLPEDFSGSRNYYTVIYFLLTSGNFSAFHKIKQDETWCFHEGSGITIHTIDDESNHIKTELGPRLEDQHYQFTVPKNCWFASEVNTPDNYALVSCIVAPGFDFDDFTLANRSDLLTQFPQHHTVIKKLTRA